MRKVTQSAFGGVLSVKLVAASVAAMLLAGCSDSVDRFANNYSNPSDSDPVYTASLMKPKHHVQAEAYQATDMADNGDAIVQSPIANAPLAKPAGPNYTASYAKTYHAPVAGAAPAYAQPKYAYNAPANSAPAYKAPVLAGNVQATDGEKAPALTPFKKKKGPKITVADGMSLYDIAKANHITVKQLADANDLKPPYTVAPGTELTVPGTMNPVLPRVAIATPVAPAAEDTAQADAPVATASEHIVAKGDTLFSLGRQYKISGFAIADANGLPHDKSLPLGRKLKIPAAGADKLAKAPSKGEGKTDMAANSAKPSTDVADASGQETIVTGKPAATDAAPAEAQISFRWPVRGRVISAYGSKPNGMKNEGINIMAPEGTNIQAADAGVVAYAGNE
ncbi:MAG: LysM peptidoglycan-binding domain-containing protein, partial [Pseudomonadota bacterium]|nr:LysM peptidoglycan-binding domain-containing protein [Pseudomonadota bacterium]